jgi:hypothetical protein
MFMKKIKIFWQPECPKCPKAKELGATLKDQGYDVEFFNTKEMDGLAESVYYDVLSTPSVVVVDGSEEKASWHGEIPDVDSLKGRL